MIDTLDLKRKKIYERHKAQCRREIEHHTKNIILQGLVSFVCVVGGMYGAQKKNIVIPLIAAPSAAQSMSKLIISETKRQRYKDILEDLERE